jgi:hypothetical protein
METAYPSSRLEIRAYHLSKEAIPLAQELIHFLVLSHRTLYVPSQNMRTQKPIISNAPPISKMKKF